MPAGVGYGKGKGAAKSATGRAKALEKVPERAKAYGLRGTTATPKAMGATKSAGKRKVRPRNPKARVR
jgi:hypothetical protein